MFSPFAIFVTEGSGPVSKSLEKTETKKLQTWISMETGTKYKYEKCSPSNETEIYQWGLYVSSLKVSRNSICPHTTYIKALSFWLHTYQYNIYGGWTINCKYGSPTLCYKV